MPNTYTLIASSTVGAGGASSIDFTSIPATYTDLLVKFSTRADSGTPGVILQLNGSGSSFTWRYLEGDGASATSASGSSFGAIATTNSATATASTFANAEAYIPNYAGSNYKSISSDSVTENNAATAYADLYATLWSNTAAINQVTLKCGTGTAKFVQYSTAYLYGIKNS